MAIPCLFLLLSDLSLSVIIEIKSQLERDMIIWVEMYIGREREWEMIEHFAFKFLCIRAIIKRSNKIFLLSLIGYVDGNCAVTVNVYEDDEHQNGNCGELKLDFCAIFFIHLHFYYFVRCASLRHYLILFFCSF